MSRLLLAFFFFAPAMASAQTVSFGPHDVRSIFYLEKSENRNQVHYAIRLDENCQPRGAAPLFGYWRDLEEGPNVTSPISSRAQRAYGVARQEVRTTASGATVRVILQAVPDRQLLIDVTRSGDRCEATARAMIDGNRAVLQRAYIQLAPFFRVAHVDLHGRSTRDGTELQERIER